MSMSKKSNLNRKQRRLKPYDKSTMPLKSWLSVDSVVSESIINSDLEAELLKSPIMDDINKPNSDEKTMDIDMARNEVMELLVSIKKEQCTKADLKDYSDSINTKFNETNARIDHNESKVTDLSTRVDRMESIVFNNLYESELNKQKLLRNNLSIMGVPKMKNEDLKITARNIFKFIGCDATPANIINCYRVDSNKSSDAKIFIVKLNNYELKQEILKHKVQKAVKLKDIVSSHSSMENQIIYINNHVTPFFGKLMSEGRKMQKVGKIHSVWLSSGGCQIKFSDDGPRFRYQSIDQLEEIIRKNVGGMTKNNNGKRIRSTNTSPLPVNKK